MLFAPEPKRGRVRRNLRPRPRGSARRSLVPEAKGSSETELVLEPWDVLSVGVIPFCDFYSLHLGIPLYGTQH